MTNENAAGTLAFIGGGNMARSLMGGLLAKGTVPAQIIVADRDPQQLSSLQQQFGVNVTQDNLQAVRIARTVVLAVKPQQMHEVVDGLRDALHPRTVLISVAAGIRAQDIGQWSGVDAVIRCMPNRPALQGCGMTALFAAANVPDAAKTQAEAILSAVGATLWVDAEADMDAVTAVSGSGPAYFFLLIEMLESTGIALGLKPEVARKLAVETAYGSGLMARDSSDAPATLRAQVTSKGGTTEAALQHLESQNVRAIFAQAVTAAAKRSAELASITAPR